MSPLGRAEQDHRMTRRTTHSTGWTPLLAALALLLVGFTLGWIVGSKVQIRPPSALVPMPKPFVLTLEDQIKTVQTPEPTPEINNTTPLSDDLFLAISTACDTYEVPVSLALAVVEQESGFDPVAIGWDGHDIGLFQIRRSNHAWLMDETGADPMDPDGNVECGVWFLAYLYDYCDEDWTAALTCYRWGPGHGSDSEYADEVFEKAEKWK